MLFNCYRCNKITFHPECPTCGPEGASDTVPLDPAYYPEFEYQSKGFVKDLFVKKRAEQELQEKLDAVLRKYREFEDPYFVNFMHVAKADTEASPDPTESSKMQLFHAVLVRLGFDELSDNPALTTKLVRSTAFRFHYADFERRIHDHVASSLTDTLTSWIDEQGTAFRRDLPLLVYYLWTEKRFADDLRLDAETLPLAEDQVMDWLDQNCESIYFELLVKRFKITLESFDPALFVTIYSVDAMDGYQFEEFLAQMYTALGHQVELTKKGADQGADLFAERFGKKIVIQAKNYRDTVGNAAIQQVLAAKSFYDCDDAIVVTNSVFTASAKELAKTTGVRLVDRSELKGYLDDYNRSLMESAAEQAREAV